ncbi:hypothetical protein C0991_006045 [Blastosporella zonata]|nr:hypothetical protein C0991_006045 [Blastosporella zonata]
MNAHVLTESRPNPIVDAPKSASSATSDSNISRSSTPPTEISSTLSSPIFAPPAETEESRRRREQSDTASAEIGKRLLKGWAMLGDECPNARCYGVPLVRPPKAGGEKDPRKVRTQSSGIGINLISNGTQECVICGGVYTTEVDWAGRERLVLTNSEVSPPANTAISPPVDVNRTQSESHPTSPVIQPAVTLVQATASINGTENSVAGNLRYQTLEESASALQSTLQTLCARLRAISTPQAVIDPSSIGATADAISKVTQALSHAQQTHVLNDH